MLYNLSLSLPPLEEGLAATVLCVVLKKELLFWSALSKKGRRVEGSLRIEDVRRSDHFRPHSGNEVGAAGHRGLPVAGSEEGGSQWGEEEEEERQSPGCGGDRG